MPLSTQHARLAPLPVVLCGKLGTKLVVKNAAEQAVRSTRPLPAVE